MSKDYELDRLKTEEQEAFRRKQAAWARYAEARERTSEAHNEMERAWNERVNARETMNCAFEAMRDARGASDEVWDEYKRLREANSARIDAIRAEADREHEEMIHCFEQASSEYEYGDKSMAPVYSEEGHEHKDRRDELNAQVHDLIQEIRDAKQHAEWAAPSFNGSSFSSAKASFESAKAEHEALQERFKRFKEERDRYKAEFDAAKAEHERLKEEFHKRLETIKSTQQDNDRRMINKINMTLVRTKPFYLGSIFGQNAKIVKRRDGSGLTDVYFAGLAAAGDGIGHGHAVIDRQGNVTYLRDAWQNHKDYLIDDRKDKPTNI
ncbi:putative nuclear RNA export factor SDE5 [Candidatus Saccharibacteria bacterium]|nr:putative nuclear RNA export factor SDE5 [Candidatus Saccharibacteria bacterium]